MAGPPITSDSEDLAPLAEINVTPLVDVMLVMLIIFMLTAPMLSAGLKVELPQAAAAKPADTHAPIVVSITSAGTLMVGADEVERSAVIAAVRKQMAGEERLVHVRGDRKVPYGEVVALLDEFAANGITRLSLIARRDYPAQ